MKPPAPRRLHLKLAAAAAIWLVIVVASTVGYKFIGGEGSTWMDAFYMTIITVTTVGYGEIIDLSGNPAGRLFTTAVLLGGLGALWYMFSVFTALLLESDLDKALRSRRMEKIIKRLHGHYIVCGYGRVGRNVAQELETTNRHFVAIDEDEPMLEAHRGSAGAEALRAAHSRPSVPAQRGLRAAGGEKARRLGLQPRRGFHPRAGQYPGGDGLAARTAGAGSGAPA